MCPCGNTVPWKHYSYPLPKSLYCLTLHDKSPSVQKNCEVLTMGVQPFWPNAASRSLSLLECDCLTRTHTLVHTFIIISCSDTEHMAKCDLSRVMYLFHESPNSFPIIIDLTFFSPFTFFHFDLTIFLPMTYFFHCFHPSVYTETWQRGTFWSQKVTSWRSLTSALPGTSTTLTTIKRQPT